MYYLEDRVVKKLLLLSYWTKNQSPTNFSEVYFSTNAREMLIRVYSDGSVYFGEELVGNAKVVYNHAKNCADEVAEIARQESIAYFMGESDY